jgi:hypothetical protein
MGGGGGILQLVESVVGLDLHLLHVLAGASTGCETDFVVS